jgi:hypothetical protein
LHALRQFTGEHLGFVLRRHAQSALVAHVRIERHGGQGDDREEEERDDQAKAQAHGVRVSLVGYVTAPANADPFL